MTEMILASLSKIWHLVPIVIAIILFKKFVNNKDNKRRIKINEENEKKGLSLELRARKKYEDLGYSVTHNEQDDLDLLCSRDDKTLLIKCANETKSKSITSEDVKEFYNNAVKYVKENALEEKDIAFRYGILYPDVLDKSALKIFMDDSYNCKYIVV